MGVPIRWLASCDSTNDEAMAWARDPRDPAPHGAYVATETQLRGRGRRGHAWHSPAGENLYVSYVLRPALRPAQVPPITLCAGLALCELVNSMGLRASIKWPNDIWVGEKKLAGILTEMTCKGSELSAVIVGVGLNVSSRAFPDELAATSLVLEGAEPPAREHIASQLREGIERWLERYIRGGVPALAEAFARYSRLDGKRVRVRIDGEVVLARARGLDRDGSLLVEDEMGHSHRVIAGEVEEMNEENEP